MGSKSRICAEKISELAKQTCTKKTNVVLYEKPTLFKASNSLNSPSKNYVASISCVNTEAINVCKGADMRKMCPPKVNECTPQPKVKRKSFLNCLLLFALKTGIAFGAVFATYALGIWGDSDRTRELFLSICQQMNEESATENNGRCDRFPINTNSGFYTMAHTWNCGVSYIFSYLALTPAFIDKQLQLLKESFEKSSAKDSNNSKDAKVSKDSKDCVCIPCDKFGDPIRKND